MKSPGPLGLHHRIVYSIGRNVSVAFVRCVYSFKVINREKLNHHGGLLVVANHSSHLDVPIMSAFAKRPVHFIARRTLAKSMIMQLVLWASQSVLTDRSGNDKRAFNEAVNLLKQGEIVIVFPEGTRTPDGEVKEFHKGAELLARRARVPILPVGIAGAYDAWPRHRSRPRLKGAIRVVFGDAIPVEKVGSLGVELKSMVEELVQEGKTILTP